MAIKIKSCTKCWRAVTLEQWRELALVEIDAVDSAETRLCPCGATLVADVAHLSTLDLRTRDEVIGEFVALERRLARRARLVPLLAALGALALTAIALALWFS